MANEWHSVRNKTDTHVFLTDDTGCAIRKTGSFKYKTTTKFVYNGNTTTSAFSIKYLTTSVLRRAATIA